MRIDPLLGWGALRALAMIFVLAGLIDIGVAFYPPHFSDPGWLFGVLSAVISGLPVLSLGLAGSLIAAIAVRSPRGVVGFGIANALLALLILAGLALFLGALPDVRRNAAIDLLPTITRSTVRTVLIGVVFFVLHAIAFRVSIKPSLSGPPNS